MSYFKVIKEVFDQKECGNMSTVENAVDAICEHLGDISDVAIRYVVQLYLKPSGELKNVELAKT